MYFINIINEDDTTDNTDTIHSIVIGSYDPNQISASPKGIGSENCLPKNTQIKYTIEFQNTGTDTAFNIKIFNKLDPSLDISTLKILNSSNTYELLLEDRELKFYFNNIQLPDSNKDKFKSNGYITYSIYPKMNFEGIIKNKSDIYFDYNAPISTNEVKLKIGNCTQDTIIAQPPPITILNNSMEIFPNPIQNSNIKLNLSIADKNVYELLLYDITGRLVTSTLKKMYDKGEHKITIKVGDLSNGTYFLKLFSNNKKSLVSKIVVTNL